MRRYWYGVLSPRLPMGTRRNGCGIIKISALHATCRIPGRSGCDASSPSARRKIGPRHSRSGKGGRVLIYHFLVTRLMRRKEDKETSEEKSRFKTCSLFAPCAAGGGLSRWCGISIVL